MPSQSITVDVTSLNRIASGLSNFEREMPGAVASSLNRTVDFMNTRVGKLVSEEYMISAKDVKKTIKKIKASRGDMKAGIKSTGGTLSFSHFKFTPKTPGKKAKVKVKIKKKEGYKEIKTSPKAFVQVVRGSLNVWKREGPRSNPIQILRSLSVPQMIQNANVGNIIQVEASRKLEERVQHEIQYRLNKLRSR
jgi:hypothetical protein